MGMHASELELGGGHKEAKIPGGKAVPRRRVSDECWGSSLGPRRSWGPERGALELPADTLGTISSTSQIPGSITPLTLFDPGVMPPLYPRVSKVPRCSSLRFHPPWHLLLLPLPPTCTPSTLPPFLLVWDSDPSSH